MISHKGFFLTTPSLLTSFATSFPLSPLSTSTIAIGGEHFDDHTFILAVIFTCFVGPVTNLITMLNPLQNEQAPPKIPMKSLQKFLQFDDASTKSSSELKLVPVDLGREPEAKAGRAQKRRKRESGRGRVDLANEGVFEDISVLIVCFLPSSLVSLFLSLENSPCPPLENSPFPSRTHKLIVE